MLKTMDSSSNLDDTDLHHYKIGSMEVFQFDCELIKQRIGGNCSEYDCGLLKISSSGAKGWGEYILPRMIRHCDLVQWASVFLNLRGLSIPEAISYIQCHEESWGTIRRNLAEAALTDLVFKLRDPQMAEKVSLERSYLMEHSQSYFSF